MLLIIVEERFHLDSNFIKLNNSDLLMKRQRAVIKQHTLKKVVTCDHGKGHYPPLPIEGYIDSR